MTGAALWVWVACAGPASDDSAGTDTSAPEDTDIEVVDDTGADTDTDTAADTDTEEPDTGPDDDAAYAALYDPLEIQRIDLEISEDNLAALREDAGTYVEAAFIHDGYRLPSIGVRLKGGPSTFEDIDGKPSFRLKLDELDSGLDYGGVDRINLHNMKADPAQAREVVSAGLWNAAGLAAPLANYAEVYVNGVLYGLYANVEEVDDAFVERRWTNPDGDLWEAADGADLTPAGVANYELGSGEGDEDALDAARREIQTGEGDFYTVANSVLDMTQFLDFWAWQVLLANEDGYPYELDDHFLYADPDDDGAFVFVPWGLDETFDSGFEWDDYTGTVAVHCGYDADCTSRFEARVSLALTAYEAMTPSVAAQSAFTLSTDAVQADTRRGATVAEVTTARTALITAINARPNAVRTQLGL
jgi:spore coat protein CotH